MTSSSALLHVDLETWASSCATAGLEHRTGRPICDVYDANTPTNANIIWKSRTLVGMHLR